MRGFGGRESQVGIRTEEAIYSCLSVSQGLLSLLRSGRVSCLHGATVAGEDYA